MKVKEKIAREDGKSKWKWAAESKVMETQGLSRISKGSRLPRMRRKMEEGQKKLD